MSAFEPLARFRELSPTISNRFDSRCRDAKEDSSHSPLNSSIIPKNMRNAHIINLVPGNSQFVKPHCTCLAFVPQLAHLFSKEMSSFFFRISKKISKTSMDAFLRGRCFLKIDKQSIIDTKEGLSLFKRGALFAVSMSLKIRYDTRKNAFLLLKKRKCVLNHDSLIINY